MYAGISDGSEVTFMGQDRICFSYITSNNLGYARKVLSPQIMKWKFLEITSYMDRDCWLHEVYDTVE